MAIVIPSSKTYNRQNPKVRDNVIERIEVGAVEVVPDNEYETPVYNETLIQNTQKNATNYKDKIIYNVGDGYRHYFYTRVETRAEYFIIDSIKIPILSKNKYIKSLLLGVSEKTENSNIGYSVSGSYKKGNTSGVFELTSITGNGYFQGTNYRSPTETKEQSFSLGEEELKITEDTYVGIDSSLVLTLSEKDETNVATIENYTIITENGIEYFKIENFKILGGIRKGKLHGEHYNYSGSISEEDIIYCNGTYEYFEPKQVQITVYGNAIGIDLVDKTVYINDENQKKVHSIDGNELMQTTNYYQSTDTNAITRAFENTLTDYAKGKETATIRCSIGDYYDYDSRDKVISVDNSTEKMSFKLYDQVIPMVYGADGKDHPMSKNQDGSPKVFQVLGSKIYYDGAVWQELSLQEV